MNMIFERDIWADLQADEVPLTFNEARKLPMFRREGRQPSVSTVYRWASRGSTAMDGRKITLETIKRGDEKCTTKSACLRFIRRLSQPADAPMKDHASENKKAREQLREMLK